MSPRALAVAWVDGADAEGFLQGLLSSDVTVLAIHDSHQSLLLDATGHIRVDLRVRRTAPNEFTLVTDSTAGSVLVALLEQYHFSEELEILGPEVVGVVTFRAEHATRIAGADITLAGVPGTVDALGDAAAIVAASGAAPIDDDTLEAMRIAAGTPRHGVDIGERTLVHEAGLEVAAVSFDKGCYLGQETVARVQYRGGVNRRLVGLRLDGSADPPSDVTHDGRVVGTMTSVGVHPVLGRIALATLRKEASAGARVAVADTAATVVDLPFSPTPTG